MLQMATTRNDEIGSCEKMELQLEQLVSAKNNIKEEDPKAAD